MKRIDLSAYGAPETVANCVEVPDVGAPGPGQLSPRCKQSMLSGISEVGAEPEPVLAVACLFRPCQHCAVLEAIGLDEFERTRHEIVGRPQVEVAILLRPCLDLIGELEQLLMAHRRIAG